MNFVTQSNHCLIETRCMPFMNDPFFSNLLILDVDRLPSLVVHQARDELMGRIRRLGGRKPTTLLKNITKLKIMLRTIFNRHQVVQEPDQRHHPMR